MLAVLQTSSTLLRFPASVADENILDEPTKRAETTPQVLQTPNKVRRRGGMVSESTYKFIDTDEESRDDNARGGRNWVRRADCSSTKDLSKKETGQQVISLESDIASLADTEQRKKAELKINKGRSSYFRASSQHSHRP
jgi:hypothetical protein